MDVLLLLFRWNNDHGATNLCRQLGYDGGSKYTAGGGEGAIATATACGREIWCMSEVSPYRETAILTRLLTNEGYSAMRDCVHVRIS